MVKTRMGSSTTSTMPTQIELTVEVKAYLDKNVDLLPTKDDITILKDEVVLLVTEKLQEQEEKISALEVTLLIFANPTKTRSTTRVDYA